METTPIPHTEPEPSLTLADAPTLEATIPNLQRIAGVYAARRTALKSMEATLDKAQQAAQEPVVLLRDALEATPEWKAFAAAREASDAANYEGTLALKTERAALADAEPLLLDMWRKTPEAPATLYTVAGSVQRRITKGVEITDPAALCQDLLSKGLFRAAITEVKANAKFLRPLVDEKALAGAAPMDKPSLAWSANQEA